MFLEKSSVFKQFSHRKIPVRQADRDRPDIYFDKVEFTLSFDLILANVWRTAPFVAIMTYAKLTAVPDSQIEAAKIDGASSLQAFAYIKIPWIMPIVERCIMLLFVWSFNSFSIIYILTNGGPAGDTTTLPYLIRQAGFVNFNFSRAATLSAVSLLIILFVFGVVRIVFMLAKKITKRR